MKVWKNYLGNTYLYTAFGICFFEFYFLHYLNSLVCGLAPQMAVSAKHFLGKELQHGHRYEKQENGK